MKAFNNPYFILDLLLLEFIDSACNPGFLPGISNNDIKNRVTFDKESIIGLMIWFSCVLYSSLRTASKSSKITMSENVLVQDNGAGKYYLNDFLLYVYILVLYIYENMPFCVSNRY